MILGNLGSFGHRNAAMLSRAYPYVPALGSEIAMLSDLGHAAHQEEIIFEEPDVIVARRPSRLREEVPAEYGSGLIGPPLPPGYKAPGFLDRIKDNPGLAAALVLGTGAAIYLLLSRT